MHQLAIHPRRAQIPPKHFQFILGLMITVCCGQQCDVRAADERQWELSNYRTRIYLAVDTSVRPQPELNKKIAEYLERRIVATLYPLWSVEFSLASGPFEHVLLHQSDELVKHARENSAVGFDKQMYLSVKATTLGYQIECREEDLSTGIWGPMLNRKVRQVRALPEQCFHLLCAAFAPLAKIRREPDQEQHVSLHFRGNRLPRRSDDAIFARAETMFQPLKVRISKRGETRHEAVNLIPWTYLTLEEMQSEIGICRVHSGIRKPFGVRRRGSVENLALGLPRTPGSTQVRFYARHDKSQALVGYEVFRREADDQPSKSMGLTDAKGMVEVFPDDASVSTLFLRSDGQLLAKVPIAAGVLPVVEVPIADDTARLKAQASLTSLREQLIDLVARRNILIARVRESTANESFDKARELLGQLDSLPGRAHFAQLLSAAERNERNRSSEPRVQSRIEKMFADTRKLLGRFLSTRQITELQSELNAAQGGSSS